MQSQSIDYGVLEKAENIYVIPGNFGWDDVGSWLAVGRLQEENADGSIVAGDVITVSLSDGTAQCTVNTVQRRNKRGKKADI